MTTLNNLILQAWNFQLSLLPVLVTYIVFELPSLIRRYYRWYYTPIYFVFFPLGHSDQLYAQYFNEDDFYRVGKAQTPAQKKKLRKRIVAVSIISMVASTIISPVFCGTLSAFYLTREQFKQFIWFLIIIKVLTLSWSLNKARKASFVERSRSFRWVILLYLFYLFVIWRLLTMTNYWVASNLVALGISGTVWAIFDYVFVELFLYGIIVSLATRAIIYVYTDPKYINESTHE